MKLIMIKKMKEKGLINFCNIFKDFNKYVESFVFKLMFKTLIINVNKKNINLILKFLRNSSNYCFKQLIDLFVIDYPQRLNRFEINYVLLSLKFNIRIILKVFLKDKKAVYSSIQLFSSASWFERECWDLFGTFLKDIQIYVVY